MQGFIGRTQAGVAAVAMLLGTCTPGQAGEGAACSPSEVARLLAPDGAGGDLLGFAVAIDGDTAIVGAMGDEPAFDPIGRQGAAYIFSRAEVGGGWTQEAKLTASDGAAGDNFGIAVAIDGDTAVVGAYSPLGFHPGAAYVFSRAGGVWSETARLSASDEELFDYFGVEVAIEGETIAVAASKADVGGITDAGAVYVFERSSGGSSGWRQRAKLTASDGFHEDHFGAAVAIAGETIVVGAPDDNTPGGSSFALLDAGSVYVYGRSGGQWAEQALLASPQPRFVGTFGCSVALEGQTLLIGEASLLGQGPGLVYALMRNGGGVWAHQAVLSSSDGGPLDHFGKSVALEGDVALIGAPFHASEAGAAYVFSRDGGLWTEQSKLTPTGSAAGDWFGVHTALEGDVALVGAAMDDTLGGSDAGSVTVFDLNCGGVVCAADLDGDGGVSVFDLLAYLDLWFGSEESAERTGDSPASIDVFDLLAYLEGWFAGCD